VARPAFCGGPSAAEHSLYDHRQLFSQGPSSNDSLLRAGQFFATDHVFHSDSSAGPRCDGKLNASRAARRSHRADRKQTYTLPPFVKPRARCNPRVRRDIDPAPSLREKFAAGAGLLVARDAVRSPGFIAELASFGKKGKTLRISTSEGESARRRNRRKCRWRRAPPRTAQVADPPRSPRTAPRTSRRPSTNLFLSTLAGAYRP